MNTAATDPLALIREEHSHLMPHLAHLEGAAAEMSEASDDDVRARLDAMAGFLRGHLLPHAESEERDLYPVVERLLRTLGGATKTMSRDHQAIGAKVDELEHLGASLKEGRPVEPSDRTEAARLLYGLAALLENHFAKEEEIYLPLLEEGLSPEEAAQLAERLAAHS